MKKVYDEFDRQMAIGGLMGLGSTLLGAAVLGTISYFLGTEFAAALMGMTVAGMFLGALGWAVKVLWKTRRNA